MQWPYVEKLWQIDFQKNLKRKRSQGHSLPLLYITLSGVVYSLRLFMHVLETFAASTANKCLIKCNGTLNNYN